MAWLERKVSGQFHVGFRLGNQKFKRSLKTSDKREAESAKSRIEENIRLVERGRLTLPEDADVAVFLLSDGKLDRQIVVSRSPTIKALFSDYRAALPVTNCLLEFAGKYSAKRIEAFHAHSAERQVRYELW